MDVIFWDIDGVMNHPKIWGAWTRLGWPESLDVALVERARAVTKKLGAKCVLSSTWRLNYERTIECLQQRGWPDAAEDFIDATPHLGTKRGIEIGARLLEHPEVIRFAIVDDDGDMTTHMKRLVQTNYRCGLTDADCSKLESLFAVHHEPARTL